MLCAVIMAGGKGERFWPLSTEDKPKQFLNLLGEGSMLQLTVKRLESVIPIERVFIVTAERYKGLIKEDLPNLPDRNIICEPEGRNTAPCIALSAFYIDKFYKDATLAVLPSDHLILDEDAFLRTLQAANDFVEFTNNSIVTLGIKPSRPETGYGYIKFEKGNTTINNMNIRKVHSFTEKPSEDKAKAYIKSGEYLWNSGIFVWKTSTILGLTKSYLENTYNVLSEVAISLDNFDERLKENYYKVDNISVDYGIMEKAENIYIIPSNFGWDDLGSWNSLQRYKEKDDDNNVIEGSVVVLKSRDNIIKTSKKTYVMGAENLIIIETDNEIMILNKDHVSHIKELKNYEE